MTLALAESLVESGTCNGEAAAGKYCEAFQEWRGYGGTAVKILRGLKAGALEPRTSGTALFPTGSFANGGAMRIAPAGFCYRNASDQALHSEFPAIPISIQLFSLLYSDDDFKGIEAVAHA